MSAHQSLQLIKLEKNHIDTVVKIHLSNLEIGILSKLGQQYLTKIFYPTMMNSQHLDAYVLSNKNSYSVLGMILYQKTNSIWSCFTLKNKLMTGLYFLKSFFRMPNLLLDVFAIFTTKYQYNLNSDNIEIFIFAIDKLYQGQGFGKFLLYETLNTYKKSYDTVFVKTHTQTATDFYKSNSFEIVAEKVNRGRYSVNILQKIL